MRKIILSILFASFALAASAAEPTAIVVIDANRGALIRWPLPRTALPKGGFQVDAQCRRKARAPSASFVRGPRPTRIGTSQGRRRRWRRSISKSAAV